MIKYDLCLFCKDLEYKVGFVWIKNILKNVLFDFLFFGIIDSVFKNVYE